MKKLIIKSTKHHLVIVAAVLVLAFVGFHSLFSHRASAESLVPSANEHIITLHDDGQDKGFITKESTLRAAFAKEHIRLDPNDRTEPDLDASLVASSYQVNIYRARVVAVRDGIVETKIITSYRTAKQIGEQAKIALHDEDLVSLVHSKDMISDGAAEVMTIERATPFDFVFYGKNMTSYTRAKTVGEMLKEKGIKLGAKDGISIDPKTPISAGLHVSVWRNGIQTVTQEEVIAKPTEQIKDADQPVGYHQLKTAGTDGKKNVTYEIEMRDGKELSRKAIASVTILEPVKEEVVVGTKMTNTFSGSFAEALARLRSCESGGTYDRNSGNGYYGAYQYNIGTWAGYGGFARADLAPASVQDEKVWLTYQRRGWQPWPACMIKMGLQDIYR